MTDSFRAYVIDRGPEGESRQAGWRDLTDDGLMDGDVTLRVTHTTLNYKDALAVTGRSPVVRRFPMIPGIDLAGTVLASSAPGFAPGDEVILNGWGVGETHMGGYAERARLRSEWLLHVPRGLTGADCMAIGTAGYTAALCVGRLLSAGCAPGDGPVLVTGASGGVGSVAVALLAAQGFEVIASTGKTDEADYLTALGAAAVLDRAEFAAKGRPLGSERFAAAVDSVGGQTLANVLSQTRYGGTVAACGLAQGFDLPATVMPFILRGVTLAGVDSVMAPLPLRAAAWEMLSDRLDRDLLARITRTGRLQDVESLAVALLDGRIRGRILLPVEGALAPAA